MIHKTMVRKIVIMTGIMIKTKIKVLILVLLDVKLVMKAKIVPLVILDPIWLKEIVNYVLILFIIVFIALII